MCGARDKRSYRYRMLRWQNVWFSGSLKTKRHDLDCVNRMPHIFAKINPVYSWTSTITIIIFFFKSAWVKKYRGYVQSCQSQENDTVNSNERIIGTCNIACIAFHCTHTHTHTWYTNRIISITLLFYILFRLSSPPFKRVAVLQNRILWRNSAPLHYTFCWFAMKLF